VVDQAWVWRRGDDSVGPPREPQHSGIVVRNSDVLVRPKLGKCAYSTDRVHGVPRKELFGLLDGATSSFVLVAEVRSGRRSSGEVEIEVGRESSRSGRAREDDLRNVPRRVVEPLRSDLVIAQQLAQSPWRIPSPKPVT